MNNNTKLHDIRSRIDALDDQIEDLISERAALVQEIAQEKRNLGCTTGFYRPERETWVLRRIQARNHGPLTDEVMVRLFREIMSACLALQQPLKIAFLGPEGTFTQAAVLKQFGQGVEMIPLAAIDEVFRKVESGAAQYGVVPVENSTEGVINHTLDMFLNSPLKITGEVELRIHQHLMSHCEDVAEIKCVYSHQQSLAQCRGWLDEYLPRAPRIAVSSNAEAARHASTHAGAAAIAGSAAAEVYKLSVLVPNIEDEPDNTTRFLVIGSHTVPASGADKTSLLISAQNRSGALARLLEPLARYEVSMTRIESRPSRRGTWDYVFFVDIEGHVDDEKVRLALNELAEKASLFKVLGAYPRAVL
jgi:chorismate mutase domain of proteobacterial P-protein, clade 2